MFQQPPQSHFSPLDLQIFFFFFLKLQFFRSAGNVIQQIKKVWPHIPKYKNFRHIILLTTVYFKTSCLKVPTKRVCTERYTDKFDVLFLQVFCWDFFHEIFKTFYAINCVTQDYKMCGE